MVVQICSSIGSGAVFCWKVVLHNIMIWKFITNVLHYTVSLLQEKHPKIKNYIRKIKYFKRKWNLRRSWRMHYMLFMNSALYAVHEQLKNICSWTFFVNHWCSWKVKTMAFMKSALYAVHEQCIIWRSWTVHYMPFMNS